MNYSEVLYTYHPSEKGDFMCRYLINDREYVIYSPEKGNISCLELESFKDITPYQLAILIQCGNAEQGIEEFEFEKVCSKNDIVTYLFKVTESNGIKIKRNNYEGYFLYELKAINKVRNIYQFNTKGEYQLLFDNEVCYAVMFENLQSDAIAICWSPLIFASLESDFRKKTTYLLPSSNPMLCAYINKIAEQRSAKITMYTDGNSLEALLFVSFYTRYFKKQEKQIEVFIDSKNITVMMSGWHPVSLVKFISKIQKMGNDSFKKYYNEEQDILLYQLKTVGDISFIIFPNNEISMAIFVANILNEINYEGIAICNIAK